jgi:hypothetical protein
VDLKQELPAGKASLNTDLAKDLASLAVDGGLVIIGVEDHHSHAGSVCGVELARLADRVDQIARDKVRPSLVVRCHEVPDPGRPGWGCLLIHVPPSSIAPHMVDHVYYGRGDRANIRLGDEQVRLILDERSRGRVDIVTDLRRMVDDDPISSEERQNGHIYLMAHPEAAAEEVLVDFLSKGDAIGHVNTMLDEIWQDYTGPHFVPQLRQLPYRIPQAEGLAFSTRSPGGRISEVTMVELTIREGGGIGLICGRGSSVEQGAAFSGYEPPRELIAAIVWGMANAFAAFAGRLGDRYAAYQGQWRLGIRLDRLQGVLPADRLIGAPFNRAGHAYTRDEYERVASASTEELINSTNSVAERLVAPLFRGLGIAHLYLPSSS